MNKDLIQKKEKIKRISIIKQFKNCDVDPRAERNFAGSN